MRTIPYDYKPDRIYLGRLASVGERVLPSVDGDIRLVKAVLATPYWLDGETRRHSSELEAAVWWVAGSGGGTDKLLTDAGVDLHAEPVRPPKRPVWLQLQFNERDTGRYQSVAKCSKAPTGLCPDEDLAVDEQAQTDLVIREDGLVSRPGFEDIQLSGCIPQQLLRALDGAFPKRVSPQRLKSVVEGWDPHTSDQAMIETVSQLRIAVRGLGLTVTKKQGKDGWALVKHKPSSAGVPPQSDQV